MKKIILLLLFIIFLGRSFAIQQVSDCSYFFDGSLLNWIKDVKDGKNYFSNVFDLQEQDNKISELDYLYLSIGKKCCDKEKTENEICKNINKSIVDKNLLLDSNNYYLYDFVYKLLSLKYDFVKNDLQGDLLKVVNIGFDKDYEKFFEKLSGGKAYSPEEQEKILRMKKVFYNLVDFDSYDSLNKSLSKINSYKWGDLSYLEKKNMICNLSIWAYLQIIAGGNLNVNLDSWQNLHNWYNNCIAYNQLKIKGQAKNIKEVINIRKIGNVNKQEIEEEYSLLNKYSRGMKMLIYRILDYLKAILNAVKK